MSLMPEKPPLAILIAVTAVGPLTINIFLPSMPGLVADLDTTYAMVQLTLSLYLAGLAIAQLVYGPLSDRFGRRRPMLVGLGIFLVGSVVCATAPTIGVLIGGRVLQAVGGCAGVVLGRAMVRDMFDRERSASMIAYITMAMVVAPMLAPTIGGTLDEWVGWRYSFVFVLVFGALVMLGCLFVLAETHGPERRKAVAEAHISILGLLKIPAFYGYTLQLSFSSATFFAFLGGAPFVVVQLMGYPPSTFGYYFLFVSACYMIGNFTAARLSTRMGTDRMVLLGTGISVMAAWALGVFYLYDVWGPISLFGSMGIIALGNGVSIPNGIAGAISVDTRLAGAASGISGFTQMAFGAGSTMLVGSLLVDTAAPLVIIMTIGATISFAMHIFGVRLFSAIR
ncbi:MAG: multidrug effflux MFS transporter [Rhodospirillales bacterium]|jgi:MFS transporter, DHA1 family, multidrug resistance protein|nr:multidrug effflux MFS transporter [Rhodospirillales bacterium]MBT4628079.1 multidrug effflux MFS transporter [Rhodospirillales bacterium]MBT5353404.1 multidrug effflux MFS transporter [Rhodospirillales bacterium]MBT5521105.1 multidrug effflux MFS transporter [Rhodospirillales bacterium]MBT6111442.1 multidrug effflux MFS transporter [Rhodospirillales bacterium]